MPEIFWFCVNSFFLRIVVLFLQRADAWPSFTVLAPWDKDMKCTNCMTVLLGMSLVVVGKHSDGCLRQRGNVSDRWQRRHTRLTACWQEDTKNPVWFQVAQKEEATRELGTAGVRGWDGHANVQTQVNRSAKTVTECVIPGCYGWYFHSSLRYKVVLLSLHAYSVVC